MRMEKDMPDISKADVYRKAAEIIVRDGKYEGDLTQKGSKPEYLMDTSLPVCALGACVRAHYELGGNLATAPYGHYGHPTSLAYDAYHFEVPTGEAGVTVSVDVVNDDRNHLTSAEDIALLLKHQAEVEEESL